MADISTADLKKEIQGILKDADLDNTSAKKVRLQLQEKLDVDLADRKKEVDQLVMEVIDEQTQDDDEEGSEEEEEEEEEEKPKKKPVKKAPKRKATPSGSEEEGDDSDSEEEKAPSDGGGSDYEPEEPVKVGRGRKPAKKSKARYGSDDEGSSGEEWGAKKKAGKKGKKRSASSDDSDYEKPKSKAKPRKKKAAGEGGARKAGGYTAPVKLSEELADIVGGDEMPRHEVVKRMWAYIKENKLQDPKNKQMIKCDDKLAKIVPTKKFRGFGMTKYLKDHMNVGADCKPKKARKAKDSEEDSEEAGSLSDGSD